MKTLKQKGFEGDSLAPECILRTKYSPPNALPLQAGTNHCDLLCPPFTPLKPNCTRSRAYGPSISLSLQLYVHMHVMANENEFPLKNNRSSHPMGRWRTAQRQMGGGLPPVAKVAVGLVAETTPW